MEAAPRKRKRDLRPKAKGKGKAVAGSSSSHVQFRPDDRPNVGLAETLSNLVGRYGAHPTQFYKSFRVCSHCQRIFCDETSNVGGHICFIDLVSSSP